MTVRPATPDDRAALDALYDREWGGPYVVGHGVGYDLRTLPTLVVDGPDGLAGVLTYHLDGDDFEVVSINGLGRQGAGTALLRAATDTARELGARRLWLVTTNDNLDALRFYQRRGMRMVGVNRGAVDAARALKPQIPEVGAYGIPLHDEIELEIPLT